MNAEQQFTEKLISSYKETRRKSLLLHEEACRFMPGGDTRTATYFDPFPHYIVKGDGAYLFDADGNRLIDFQNNYTSLIHGHNHKPTVEAIKEQVGLGTAYAAPFENQTRLAEILVNRIPSVDLIRFTN
ncbi:MAG TPA: aminotransferase class III-fold pyridoxal phosphate-dependent enzyme, partial [Bacillota bacterium]|nr:aminotransferase class III-fold pyridoxal phosphate-dependent enzyme [Bacillota bacterium]